MFAVGGARVVCADFTGMTVLVVSQAWHQNMTVDQWLITATHC